MCDSTGARLSSKTAVAYIKGVEVSTLIDTGSSSSFINETTAKRLKLKVFLHHKNVLMASSNLKNNIAGPCVADLNINGVNYNFVSLKIMKNLCTDILLGHDFQSQHKQVVFKFGGRKDDFIGARNVCAISSVTAAFPSLFRNILNDVKPTAVKSRQFNKSVQEFINREITRQRAKGIIQPRISPWRAQVVVVKGAENDKQQMCVDYSQTINLYTDLDAYPLPRIDVW